jgi:hypothetical protein
VGHPNSPAGDCATCTSLLVARLGERQRGNPKPLAGGTTRPLCQLGGERVGDTPNPWQGTAPPAPPMVVGWLEVDYFYGFYGVGRGEAEDLGVEVELGFCGAGNVLGLAEAVPLALEFDIGHGEALLF